MKSPTDHTPPETTARDTRSGGKEARMPGTGERVGHCRIQGLIAAGGMANVYKVWHEQLEVTRAIKILKPGFTAETKGRLETEAKISANLRHPNVVEVYGVGFWNGIPYIEMEFIDGPSLKDILEQNRRLPVPFALAVSHFVCKALHFAHNQDMTLYGKVYDRLIHRDIKPANILITSRGVVKLADFGIARPSEVSLHTVGSKVMGTFAYLSPEQLNGERLDQRADVYALGTVIYEMVTGAKTFPQRMLAELVQKKSRGHYVPVESLGIELPKALCSTVEKSLELEKERRYSDSMELDQDVLEVLRKLTSSAPDEIVRDYMKNPQPGPLRADGRSPSGIGTLLLTIASILLVSTIVSVAAYKLLSGNRAARSTPRPQGHIEESAAAGRADDRGAPARGSKPLNAGRGKRGGTPEPSDGSVGTGPTPQVRALQESASSAALRTTATVPDPESLSDARPRTAVHNARPAIDHLGTGMQAYRDGNYQAAAEHLRLVDRARLKLHERQTVTVYLLESLLKTGDIDYATTVSRGEPVDDGLFYLLKGEALFRAGNYTAAESVLEKAQTRPSRFSGDVQCRAIHLWAKVRDAIYSSRPNLDNKQASARSWTSFINACCAGAAPAGSCADAVSRTTELAQ